MKPQVIDKSLNSNPPETNARSAYMGTYQTVLLELLRARPSLRQEFTTVAAILASESKTRAVDALILSWVKYEKQLRRIFCFLVFQHPVITRDAVSLVISNLAKESGLYPQQFRQAIEVLSGSSIQELIGNQYSRLDSDIARIQKYRNKIFHGQLSGYYIPRERLEMDTVLIAKWISLLAAGADRSFGYDGLGRNTFRAAKQSALIAVQNFPFDSVDSFGNWLKKLAKAKSAK